MVKEIRLQSQSQSLLALLIPYSVQKSKSKI